MIVLRARVRVYARRSFEQKKKRLARVRFSCALVTLALLMSAPSQGTQPIPAGEALRCSTSQAGHEATAAAGVASARMGSRLSEVAAKWLKLKKTSGETELEFAARYVARHMSLRLRSDHLLTRTDATDHRITAAIAPEPLLPPPHSVIRFVDSTSAEVSVGQRARVEKGTCPPHCTVMQTGPTFVERRGSESGRRASGTALSARGARAHPRPPCVYDVQTQRAVRHGMVEVYHQY